MSTPKVERLSGPRPDRYSKKKSGPLKQSLRLTVDENKLIRKAAGINRQSINNWMVGVLMTAAKAQLKKHEKEEA